MRDVISALRDEIIAPAEGIIAIVKRLEEMNLASVVREHVDQDLRELARSLPHRLRRETSELNRLGITLRAFEQRTIETDRRARR